MIKIAVYIDNGNVFEYDVDSPEKAREHASAIAATGYRRVSAGVFEHFPQHRVLKIKATGEGIQTSYPDTHRGT